LSHNYDKSLRPKFGLRIILDPVFVARSSSVLSWVIDLTWVLEFYLGLFG